MDLLSDVLKLLDLTGTLYFRTSFRTPWGVSVPEFQNVARFHYAHRGRCFVRVNGATSPLALEQGDLVIVPHGAGHILSDPAEAPAPTVDEVVAQSGFTGKGALVWGGVDNGHETQLICGHFAFDTGARHHLLEALPPAIHIRDYGGSAPDWLENTLRIIGAEAGQATMGADLIAMKLSEIVFAQALRKYLETDGIRQPGLAGYADTRITRALEAMHSEPEHGWTVEELARVAGMSRAAFAGRFNDTLKIPPLTYLTDWRMQTARRMLLDTDIPIIEIAERTGYSSEASFGRVFKKHFEVRPAGYRRKKGAPVEVSSP
ncbi:MAG: AraC family transcriptional regulator [Alphaproteobacteria bacterium]